MRAIDYFDKSVEAFPARTALQDGDRRFSYQETHALSQRIAQAMWANGMRGEQRAAVFSYNRPEVIFCMLGILRAGAVWVPINFRNASAANIEYLNYSGTEWLFYDGEFEDEVREIKAQVPSLHHVICISGQGALGPSLDEFMLQGANAEEYDWADPYGNGERLMGLVPTGGTTGPAKGVRVTNLAWGTMTEMACQYWQGDGPAVCLCTAPLSHAAGVVAFTVLALGGTNIVMQGFDAEHVLSNIEGHRVTHLFLPPTALYSLLAHPRVCSFDYSSLRVFLVAGSPVSADKLKQAVEIFGPCMCQCYGQTEAPMLLTWLDAKTVAAATAGEHPERLRSCGKPTSAVRLAIMDEAGRLLSPYQIGEIVARGTLISAGYHQMPEATAEVRTHNWHHTGDVGYQDEDGYVYVVDRKKDMIITGGFNVFCAEVEAAIMSLPEVQECAVIGVPDNHWGEAVKAIVVLARDQILSEAAIIAQCKLKLGSMKSPKSVEFWPAVPKTPAGKLDRRTIRAPFWEGVGRQVH